MATIVRAPDRLSAAERKATVGLFLAGPFDDGGSPTTKGKAKGTASWRDRVIDAFPDEDLVIFDPRNDRWSSLAVGSPGRRGAYDWQCATAFDADVVLVWVPEGSHAPTALMILGYLGAKRGNAKKGNSVVVGGDGWDGLVALFAQNQRLFPAGDDLDEVIRIVGLQLDAARRVKRPA
jgi:hypothetical protein